MLTTVGSRVVGVDGPILLVWAMANGEDYGHLALCGNAARPDLTDPATLGCLLALVRESTGDPHAVVEWWGPYGGAQVRPSDDLYRSGYWRVLWTGRSGIVRRADAATEEEALVGVLEASHG